MKNPFFYVLLAVLVLLDGWLMAHPNLIGRAGIFFYNYNYLRTFPHALGTISAVVGVALLLAWASNEAGRIAALSLLASLTLAGGYWVVTSTIQFNSGIYKLTGAGFRAGSILLPALVTLVFGKSLFDRLSHRS